MSRIVVAAMLWAMSAAHVAAQINGAALAGRVMDASDGSPIAFASVVIENATSGQQLTGALTSESGRFVIQGLPPGRYTVRISFSGFDSADADVLVSPLNQN